MESNRKKTKQKLILVIAVCLSIIVGSFAYWRLTLVQTNSNIVESSCLKISYTDENDINLQKAYPMDDDNLYEFLQTATPYHFAITNECDTETDVVINLETLESEKKLEDQYVDVILYDGTQSYTDIMNNKSESRDVYTKKSWRRTYNNVNLYDYKLTENEENIEKVILESLKAYKLYTFTLNGNETKTC